MTPGTITAAVGGEPVNTGATGSTGRVLFGDAAAAYEQGRLDGTAAERGRLRPLLLACHNLYDVVWNKTATVEIDEPGYNGLSYDDTNAIDEAAGAVENLLAAGDFADLLCPSQPAGTP